MLINTAAGDGDVHMRMPVESSVVGMNRAENADVQSAFSGSKQQVIDRQAAEVVKQPAVDLKQPQRIGEGEDEVDPVAVRQAVELSGNPQVGGLFTAGGAGTTTVAGVGDVFNMRATGVIRATVSVSYMHTGGKLNWVTGKQSRVCWTAAGRCAANYRNWCGRNYGACC